MAKATEARREALRARLIESATATIRDEGAAALRARALAEDAGCSVGAIYTVFGDLPQLVLAVNGETFRRLGAHVVAGTTGDAPVERLVSMSEAYLDFAASEPRLWRALFDVQMTESDAPGWYLAALDRVLSLIDAPLAEIFPDLGPEEVRVRTRALFSAVHGIVWLGLESRISAAPRARLREMIRFVLEGAARHG